jgi:hypothetical protein
VLSYLSEGMMRGIDMPLDSTRVVFFIPKLLPEKKKGVQNNANSYSKKNK